MGYIIPKKRKKEKEKKRVFSTDSYAVIYIGLVQTIITIFINYWLVGFFIKNRGRFWTILSTQFIYFWILPIIFKIDLFDINNNIYLFYPITYSALKNEIEKNLFSINENKALTIILLIPLIDEIILGSLISFGVLKLLSS